MSENLPPSFEPAAHKNRPDTADASKIEGAAIPRTRILPQSQQPTTKPPAAPPSYHPANQQPITSKKPAPRPGTIRQSTAEPPNPVPSPHPTRRRHRGRRIAAGSVLILALLLAWPIGLLWWANGKITHTEALSGIEDTAGATYLLVGSDSREDGQVQDDAEGQRSDTILLLHKPTSGTTSLISLPRDTYVEIEGYGPNKLNAAYAYGGAPLLVSTVEDLTGITVDHYVEVGMGGVVDLVDAVGGVELCLDYDVSDALSQLEWTAGCHVADGTTALAFARMRYSDPLGDFGRQQRQRQVISAVANKALTPSSALNPTTQIDLIEAGVGALTTDTDSGILDLGVMALAFLSATGEDGVSGTPPISSSDYQPGGIGSTVLLDPDLAPAFFQKVLDGTVTQEDTEQF